jgi:hypothetical protein
MGARTQRTHRKARSAYPMHEWERRLRARSPLGGQIISGGAVCPRLCGSSPAPFPVLVRGQRLDAAGVVRFNTLTEPGVSGPLLTQLQILVPTKPATPAYQDDGNLYVRFDAPGCYGLQIDWSQGTEWIIFRAYIG